MLGSSEAYQKSKIAKIIESHKPTTSPHLTQNANNVANHPRSLSDLRVVFRDFLDAFLALFLDLVGFLTMAFNMF